MEIRAPAFRPVVRLILFSVLVGGWGGVRGVEAQANWTPIPAEYAPATDDRPSPEFAVLTDRALPPMGLAPLRTVSLSEGTTELRIWVGFGMALRSHLLRLLVRPEGITGELIAWGNLSGNPERDDHLGGLMSEERVRAGGHGCNEPIAASDPPSATRTGAVRTTRWTFACRTDFRDGEPDWAEVHARLSEAQVASLPDPSTLQPPGRIIDDGVTLEVEVLTERTYRTYTYGNPRMRPWPEARFAETIMQIVGELTGSPHPGVEH